MTHTAHNIKDSTEDSVEDSTEDSSEDSTEDSIEDAEVGVQPQHHGWRSRRRRPVSMCPLPVLQPQLCPGALIAGASY